MNKRRLHRKMVSDTTVELFDGTNRFAGTVHNVSNTGIETCLDSPFNDPFGTKFDLRLSHDGKIYRLGAIARWQKNDTEGNRLGLRICEAPRDWAHFVDSFPFPVQTDSQSDY